MFKKGQLAQFGRSLVVILAVNGDSIYYRVVSKDGAGATGNTWASQLKEVKPKVAPAVKPERIPGSCPSCGAQNFVIGVACPNCEYIQAESFSSWLKANPV